MSHMPVNGHVGKFEAPTPHPPDQHPRRATAPCKVILDMEAENVLSSDTEIYPCSESLTCSVWQGTLANSHADHGVGNGELPNPFTTTELNNDYSPRHCKLSRLLLGGAPGRLDVVYRCQVCLDHLVPKACNYSKQQNQCDRM